MSSSLKELKIPKYSKGMAYDDYIIKLMSAASTRGKMKDVLIGTYMTKMPPIDENGERPELSEAQKLMEADNDRAFAELLMAMPDGRLTRIVSQAKSNAFPNGCAYTALQHLKKKIGKISPANEALLKEVFESSTKLGKTINPAKYIDKLVDIKNELYDKYQYVKTDKDVVDQVIRVLPQEYEWTRMSIKQRIGYGNSIDLTELQQELQDVYEGIKKKTKKNVDVSDDSSEEDKAENEKAMMMAQLSNASKQGSILHDPNNPNIAYMIIDPKNMTKTNYNPYFKHFKGQCHACGEWGHKGAECPNKKQEAKPAIDGPPQPKCTYCGSYFHNTRICWEREENAYRRPPGWISQLNKIKQTQPTQMISNLQPVILCEICGSPMHSSSTCPSKKQKENPPNVAFHAKHSENSDDDSNLSKEGSDIESLSTDSSGEFNYMVTLDDDELYKSDEEKEELELFNFIKQVANAKHLTDENEWIYSIVIKLRRINVDTIFDVVRDIKDINGRLCKIGESLLLSSTLTLMLNMGVNALKVVNEPELKQIITMAARRLNVKNHDKWMDQVERKLSSINITTSSNLMKSAFKLNYKLLLNNHQPLKDKTARLLHILATKEMQNIRLETEMEFGLFTLCEEAEEDQDKPKENDLELDNSLNLSLLSVILTYIRLRNVELKILNNDTLNEGDATISNKNLTDDINFILNDPFMFRIISHLSLKNAFKNIRDTEIDNKLSCLCFWLHNKESYPYICNNSIKNISNKKMERNNYNDEENELVSLNSSDKTFNDFTKEQN